MNEADFRRLYFVNFYYPPLARSRRRYHFARALANRGFRVTVPTVANPAGFLNRFVRDPSCDIHDPDIEVVRLRVLPWWAAGEAMYVAGWIPCPQWNWSWAVERYLRERLRREPGVVLSLYPPIASHLGAARAAEAAGCPLVLDFRDEYLDLDTRGLRRIHASRSRTIEERLVRQAALVSVTTEPVRQHLLERYGLDPARVVVTYNGIGGALPPVRERSFTGTLRVLYAGALTGHQAPEILCDAWRILRDREPLAAEQVRIVYFGPETRYARKHLLPRLQHPYITYGGFVSADRAQEEVARADTAFFSLSGDAYRYATPGKLFEYVGHGVPLLASVPDGAAAAIVRQHDLGLVTPPGDAGALAGALNTLVQHRDQLRRFRENALAVRATLTLDEQVGRLADAIKEIPQ